MMSKEDQQAMKTCFDKLLMVEPTVKPKRITSTMFFSREYTLQIRQISDFGWPFARTSSSCEGLMKSNKKIHLCL